MHSSSCLSIIKRNIIFLIKNQQYSLEFFFSTSTKYLFAWKKLFLTIKKNNTVIQRNLCTRNKMPWIIFKNLFFSLRRFVNFAFTCKTFARGGGMNSGWTTLCSSQFSFDGLFLVRHFFLKICWKNSFYNFFRQISYRIMRNHSIFYCKNENTHKFYAFLIKTDFINMSKKSLDKSKNGSMRPLFHFFPLKKSLS